MSVPLVVKVGGSTLGSADTSFADIASLALAGDVPVVVHGGGAEATSWLEHMGIESRFERGKRVTDENALPVVVAVFAGLVNKRVVAAIGASGAAACGLSGVDADVLECTIPDPSLGFVGKPLRVQTTALDIMREAGVIPVVAPVGFVPREGERTLVNVNADTVAGSVAAAMKAREVIFLTDVEGVRERDGSPVSSLTRERAKSLIADGTIAGGMIPKVQACLHAAALGVPARITDGRVRGALLDRDYGGTVFVP